MPYGGCISHDQWEDWKSEELSKPEGQEAHAVYSWELVFAVCSILEEYM